MARGNSLNLFSSHGSNGLIVSVRREYNNECLEGILNFLYVVMHLDGNGNVQ